MSEAFRALLSAAAGAALGLLFFGGLWLTVRAIPASPHPVRLALLSFLGRTGAVVLGFGLLALGGTWRTALAGLAGFVLARLLLARRLRVRAGGG